MLGIKYWPEIIKQAAQSRFGLIALGLLLVGVALLVLFGRVRNAPWVRVVAFAMMIAAVVWLIQISVVEAQRMGPVAQDFVGGDRDNDCNMNRKMSYEHCLPEQSRVTSWNGPTVTSANCGSGIAGTTATPGKPNCVTVTTLLKGCGYTLGSCNGSGWVNYSFVVHGVQPVYPEGK